MKEVLTHLKEKNPKHYEQVVRVVNSSSSSSEDLSQLSGDLTRSREWVKIAANIIAVLSGTNLELCAELLLAMVIQEYADQKRTIASKLMGELRVLGKPDLVDSVEDLFPEHGSPPGVRRQKSGSLVLGVPAEKREGFGGSLRPSDEARLSARKAAIAVECPGFDGI